MQTNLEQTLFRTRGFTDKAEARKWDMFTQGKGKTCCFTKENTHTVSGSRFADLEKKKVTTPKNQGDILLF